MQAGQATHKTNLREIACNSHVCDETLEISDSASYFKFSLCVNKNYMHSFQAVAESQLLMVICYLIMLLMVTNGELSYFPYMHWLHTKHTWEKSKSIAVCTNKQSYREGT